MNYETACNRSNAICVGCTLATPSIMQCNSNAIQPHVPCSWDCDLCPRGCDCNAPYQLLLLLNLLTCRQITVNNLQKILLLQRNQHFYLLTFRSLIETETSKGKNVGCVEVTVFFVIINQPKNMFHVNNLVLCCIIGREYCPLFFLLVHGE